MTATLESVIDRLPQIRQAVEAVRETLLANLVMIGEIPAPTFSEQARARFLSDRFAETGLQHVSTDEMDNAAGVIPGAEGGRNILVVAHTDTLFAAKDDHTISVEEDSVIGPGLGDNSLGVAVLATMPTLMEHLDVTFNSNIVLLGSSRSHGRGDLEGMRFFMDNMKMPVTAGICLEGVKLGRLSYCSIGMMRGEITVSVPEEYDWTRFRASGAIRIINDVMNHILAIPLPRQPRTTVLFGAIRGGAAFDVIATHATLQFEIRSESAEMVQQVTRRIRDITEEVSAETDAVVTLDTIAHREPGGVAFGHPIVRHARKIIKALDVEPRLGPSLSELSTFISHSVPAVTLGITTGERRHKANELLHISPMITGVTQLAALLLAMDAGLEDDEA
ncbi:MAG: M20/M25/M40 family metallo-hydrolase [Phycisphaeraceae bacterium]